MCACWRDAARPRLTSSRADRGFAGRDLCATRGCTVALDAVDPYARGVLARARRPGSATSCAKPARRRRDFWVTFPRAHRETPTARRALAAPAVVNDGVELCACCIVPDSRRRRRGFMFNPAPRGRRLRSRCRTRRAASRRRTPRRRRGRSTATAAVSGCGRAARRSVAAGLHTSTLAIVSQQLVNNASCPIGPGTERAGGV